MSGDKIAHIVTNVGPQRMTTYHAVESETRACILAKTQPTTSLPAEISIIMLDR